MKPSESFSNLHYADQTQFGERNLSALINVVRKLFEQEQRAFQQRMARRLGTQDV